MGRCVGLEPRRGACSSLTASDGGLTTIYGLAALRFGGASAKVKTTSAPNAV